jgi:hypothetical protein
MPGFGVGKVNGIGGDQVDLGNSGDSININWTRGSCQKVTLTSTNQVGSVWVTFPCLSVPRREVGAAGLTSSAIAWSGYNYTTTDVACNINESWNGSAWASTSAFPVNKVLVAYCGNATQALSIGGGTTSSLNTTDTYIWNASSWATTTALNVSSTGGAACGGTSSALCCGGYSAVGGTTNVSIWNGSSWASTSVMPVGRFGAGAVGSVTSALCFGGYSNLSSNYIWNGSSWASTSSLNVVKGIFGSAGDTSTAVCFGGYGGGPLGLVAITEQWNGSSWSKTSNMNNAHYATGVGTYQYPMSVGGTYAPATSPSEILSPAYSVSVSFTDPSQVGVLILKTIQPPVAPQVQYISMPSNVKYYYNKTLSIGANKVDVITLYCNGSYYTKVFNQGL